MTEPTNADLLAAIDRLGTRLEKIAKDTNATVSRIDARLKSVEATVNEISVTTSVSSKAITTMRADIEDLERRVAKLENV